VTKKPILRTLTTHGYNMDRRRNPMFQMASEALTTELRNLPEIWRLLKVCILLIIRPQLATGRYREKGKSVPVHATKIYTGSRYIVPRILNAQWRLVVKCAPSNFVLWRKEPPRCPLTRRLGGPESWSGRSGDKKNLLPMPRIEFQSAQSLTLPNFYICTPK